MPPEYTVQFAEMRSKIGKFHRREWCSAQRIRITMIAGGNHSIVSMNASPTVFSAFPEQPYKHQFVWQQNLSVNRDFRILRPGGMQTRGGNAQTHKLFH